MSCASVVSPIEIFAADEVGRRRHWADDDKLRIVEASLRGYLQGAAVWDFAVAAFDLAAGVSPQDTWCAGG